MIDKELKATWTIIKVIDKIYSKNTHKLLEEFIKYKSKEKSSDIYLKDIIMEEAWIEREDGTKLHLSIYKPANLTAKDKVPGVLWLHGGNFIFGMADISKSFAKRLIETRDCVVVVPAYTLASEKPYPAALKDAYGALLWMKNNAESLGIKSNQLMIGGYNSGGNLTAATTLYARDKGEVAVAFQMPIYPMLDNRLSGSFKINKTSFKNSNIIYEGWRTYLGNLHGRHRIPSYAAPGRAKNFRNLPPAVTFVGEIDSFKEETTLYVENLRKAGTEVKFEVFNGCYQGFSALSPNSKKSKDALKFLMDAFAYAVDNYHAEQKNFMKVI